MHCFIDHQFLNVIFLYSMDDDLMNKASLIPVTSKMNVYTLQWHLYLQVIKYRYRSP